jgi:hypothetical protein
MAIIPDLFNMRHDPTTYQEAHHTLFYAQSGW